MEIPKDCPEQLIKTLETLIEIRKNIFNLIIEHLKNGECKYLSDDLYGYPYDYKLYSKDSLDPQVKILNGLLEKVEQTYSELVTEYDIEQNVW